MRVFDCFPFYNELDVLDIRLNELDSVVSNFFILESHETYGGQRKPLYLREALRAGRFAKFADKIVLLALDELHPKCVDRTTGRLREAYQRNMIMPALAKVAHAEDAIIFSDCDEIPSNRAVREACGRFKCMDRPGPYRFKQRSFYYTVNRLADYGHDFASRARIGLWYDVETIGSLYDFRMYRKNDCPAIEDGGWHFGYFGGVEHIKNKVATLSPFISEYKLFGDKQLVRDIVDGKDLHHRRCELPDTFTHCASDDATLPAYFLANRDKFAHFTEDYYKGLL